MHKIKNEHKYPENQQNGAQNFLKILMPVSTGSSITSNLEIGQSVDDTTHTKINNNSSSKHGPVSLRLGD